MAGLNRALINKSFSVNDSDEDMCFFISHISIDKDFARSVADFLMNHVGVDIYFDEDDEEIQHAVINNDYDRITNFIESGISRSTHIICLVTPNTQNSWWIPYEIGYAKKSDKDIISIIHKDVFNIPAFLDITTKIKSSSELMFFTLQFSFSECLKASEDSSYTPIYGNAQHDNDNLDLYLR